MQSREATHLRHQTALLRLPVVRGALRHLTAKGTRPTLFFEFRYVVRELTRNIENDYEETCNHRTNEYNSSTRKN